MILRIFRFFTKNVYGIGYRSSGFYDCCRGCYVTVGQVGKCGMVKLRHHAGMDDVCVRQNKNLV
jgi:hypothetical protein